MVGVNGCGHLITCTPGPQSTADEVVFMFGHMLYEMASGEPLKVATIDSCPPIIDLAIC